jgi:hypothetical protein
MIHSAHSKILTILIQTIYTKGGGVLLARTILNSLEIVPKKYFNDCELPNQNNAGRMANSAEEEDIIIDTKVRKEKATVIESKIINDVQQQNAFFYIFPNPSKDELNIVFEKNDVNKNYNIEVYNNLGQIIFSLQNKNTSTKIETSSFTEGIYLLKVINTATFEIFTNSFVVKK